MIGLGSDKDSFVPLDYDIRAQGSPFTKVTHELAHCLFEGGVIACPDGLGHFFKSTRLSARQRVGVGWGVGVGHF